MLSFLWKRIPETEQILVSKHFFVVVIFLLVDIQREQNQRTKKKNSTSFSLFVSDRKAKKTIITNFFSFSLLQEQAKKTKQKEKATCFSFCFLMDKPLFLFKSTFLFFFVFVMPVANFGKSKRACKSRVLLAKKKRNFCFCCWEHCMFLCLENKKKKQKVLFSF